MQESDAAVVIAVGVADDDVLDVRGIEAGFLEAVDDGVLRGVAEERVDEDDAFGSRDRPGAVGLGGEQGQVVEDLAALGVPGVARGCGGRSALAFGCALRGSGTSWRSRGGDRPDGVWVSQGRSTSVIRIQQRSGGCLVRAAGVGGLRKEGGGEGDVEEDGRAPGEFGLSQVGGNYLWRVGSAQFGKNVRNPRKSGSNVEFIISAGRVFEVPCASTNTLQIPISGSRDESPDAKWLSRS